MPKGDPQKTLHLHDAAIRELSGAGKTDKEIAAEIGASPSGVYFYRQRESIGEEREYSGAEPSPTAAAQRLQHCNDLFGLQMRGRRYVSIVPTPIGRITGRTDPALGLGASAAYSCAEAGMSRQWKNQ